MNARRTPPVPALLAALLSAAALASPAFGQTEQPPLPVAAGAVTPVNAYEDPGLDLSMGETLCGTGCCDMIPTGGGCGDGCCGAVGCGDVCCGCRPGFWFEADALIWWTRGVDTPALATTGSATGQGVMGDTDTVILFGDSVMLDDSTFGGRFRLGKWLDGDRCRGIEVTYLRLEGADDSFTASDADFAVLSRPFFNTSTNAEDALNVVLPSTASGSLQINMDTQFDALDAAYLFNISKHGNRRCDFLIGYRYLELADSFTASQNTLSLAGPTAGATIDLYDRFESENTFHGGLFAMRFQNQMNPCWSLESSIGVALGGVRNRASINGSTTTTDASSNVTTTTGGLLTQPTNIGEYRDSRFSASYEVGVTLKRRIGEHCAVTVGYDYLAWSSVYRAAEQIDRDINETQLSGGTLTGSATPGFPEQATGYWAQGVKVGFEALY